MAVVYQYIGILTVNVVIFFRSPSVFHSQDSFPSTFCPRLWETSSAVGAVGMFAAEVRRELWARPSRLSFIYVVHAYCWYVIGQHSDNWNLLGRFLYRCSFWSEVHHVYKTHSRWTSSQFSAVNTPTATTPEDVSHSRGQNVEGKESWEWKTPGPQKKMTSSTVRIPT